MNATHLVTLESILLSLLAGCSNLPADQACRAGLEKELEVFDANGYLMWNHRSPNFVAFLVEAELDELAGDYQSCVDNLALAHEHGHGHGYNTGHSAYTQKGPSQNNSRSGATRAANPRGSGGKPN